MGFVAVILCTWQVFHLEFFFFFFFDAFWYLSLLLVRILDQLSAYADKSCLQTMLLIKVLSVRKHATWLFSRLKQRNNFTTAYLCVYPLFCWGNTVKKVLSRPGGWKRDKSRGLPGLDKFNICMHGFSCT